ncbi:MAG: spinster family MFS transporter [Blastocatellia bacterium]
MTEPQKQRTGFVLLILFVINLLNFFDRQLLATVTEPIRREWGLNDSQMGILGTAFTLIYAFVGVPLGRWADRGKRTTILSWSVGIWSLFTAASGMAWNYWTLFAARLGVGVGEAGCSPAANALIGDLFPPARRARAISIFMLGLPIGIFLSGRLGGALAAAWGWRWTFFVATLPGLIMAALVLLIREPARTAAVTAANAEQAKGGWAPFLDVMRIPTMWWIALSGALHNFNAYAVNAFTPALLGRYHGLDLKEANSIAAWTLGGVGVIGLLAGGVAADWGRKWRPDGRMLIATLALLISTPLVYLAIDQPRGAVTGFIVPMAIGWMLIYVYYVTVYPAIQDVVAANLRGTAMALYFFAMYVLGGAFGTTVLGIFSDYYARRAMTRAGGSTMTEAFRAEGLHDAFYIVPLVSLTLAVVLFLGSRTITKDMRKMKSEE